MCAQLLITTTLYTAAHTQPQGDTASPAATPARGFHGELRASRPAFEGGSPVEAVEKEVRGMRDPEGVAQLLPLRGLEDEVQPLGNGGRQPGVEDVQEALALALGAQGGHEGGHDAGPQLRRGALLAGSHVRVEEGLHELEEQRADLGAFGAGLVNGRHLSQKQDLRGMGQAVPHCILRTAVHGYRRAAGGCGAVGLWDC